MVLEMKNSPWYQQSIFFYLHFQFLGVYFIWILALLANRVKLLFDKKAVISVVVSLVLLYAHSLDYSFNHWAIQLFGGLGSILLFTQLFNSKFDFIANADKRAEVHRIAEEIAINLAIQSNYDSHKITTLKTSGKPKDTHIIQSLYYGCANHVAD